MTEQYNVAHPGLGCTFGYSTANTYSSPVAIGQVKSIGGLSFESVMADTTGINSTAAEQVAVGLFKGGEVEVGFIYNAADPALIALEQYITSTNSLSSTTTLYWTFTVSKPVGPSAATVSTGKKYQFPGYISKLGNSGWEPESVGEGSVTIAITGDITITAQS